MYYTLPPLDAQNALRSIVLANEYSLIILRCALTVGHSGGCMGHFYSIAGDAYHTHWAQLSLADQPGGRPWRVPKMMVRQRALFAGIVSLFHRPTGLLVVLPLYIPFRSTLRCIDARSIPMIGCGSFRLSISRITDTN